MLFAKDFAGAALDDIDAIEGLILLDKDRPNRVVSLVEAPRELFDHVLREDFSGDAPSDQINVLRGQDLRKEGPNVPVLYHDAFESLTHGDDALGLVDATLGFLEVAKGSPWGQLGEANFALVDAVFDVLGLEAPPPLVDDQLNERVLPHVLEDDSAYVD